MPKSTKMHNDHDRSRVNKIIDKVMNDPVFMDTLSTTLFEFYDAYQRDILVNGQKLANIHAAIFIYNIRVPPRFIAHPSDYWGPIRGYESRKVER